MKRYKFKKQLINGNELTKHTILHEVKDNIVQLNVLNKDGNKKDILQHLEPNEIGYVSSTIQSVANVKTINYKQNEFSTLKCKTIPSSIDNDTFSNPSTIKELILPEGVVCIEESAFWNNSVLTSVVFPNSLKYIRRNAFSSAPLLELNIPDTVEAIGGAFSKSSPWWKNLPNGPVYVGKFLYGHKGIASSVVEIKDGIKVICREAFIGSKPTVVHMPDSVITLDDLAFMQCDTLQEIKLSHTLTHIGKEVFLSCLFPTIELPSTLQSIGDKAFLSCDKLKTITIPKSVTHLGTNVFNGCILDSISVDKENQVYDSRNDCNALIETATNTLIKGSYATVIPEDVTTIGDEAFKYYSELNEIDLPSNLKHIGLSAFISTGLTSITIPESITKIGNSAFSSNPITTVIWNAINAKWTSSSDRYFPFAGVKSITSITFGDKVQYVPDFLCEYNTQLTSITFPSNIRGIGKMVLYGCSGLKTITCHAKTPPTLGTSNNLTSVTAVYVPEESIQAYKTATNWSYYSSKIQAIPT